MPDKKQLSRLRESDMEYFNGRPAGFFSQKNVGGIPDSILKAELEKANRDSIKRDIDIWWSGLTSQQQDEIGATTFEDVMEEYYKVHGTKENPPVKEYDILIDLDMELASLEDVLHGIEGATITRARVILSDIKNNYKLIKK